MKVKQVVASNYLAARGISIDVVEPIVLFNGPNTTGKSSLYEAIVHCFSGRPVRIQGDKKVHLKALVTDDNGAKSGFAAVTLADDTECCINVPSGKGAHIDSPEIAFVVNTSAFSSLSLEQRGAFLFDLAGIKRDGPGVKNRLISIEPPEGEKWIAWGCDKQKVEQIMPILRAGFEDAVAEAKEKAKEARASWKSVTHETWGSEKANGWKADRPDTFSSEVIRTREEERDTLDRRIEEANQKLGAIQAGASQRQTLESRIGDLRTKAQRLSALQEKLVRDQHDYDTWSGKMEELPPPVGEQPRTFSCPCCGVVLQHRQADGALIEYTETKSSDPDQELKRQQWQAAVDLYARSVANDKRDIAEAEAAAAELSEAMKTLDGLPAPVSADSLRTQIEELRAGRKTVQALIDSMYATNRQAMDADERTQKATAHQKDLTEWLRIAEALSPSGIQGEMLSAALDPFRDSLARICEWADFPNITLDVDMEVLSDGRPYPLLSRSEKWRADAAIALTIAELSGLKIIALDEFDLLDLKSRPAFIGMLLDLVDAGALDTAFIFATAKAVPPKLPEGMQAVWIENGMAGGIREAA